MRTAFLLQVLAPASFIASISAFTIMPPVRLLVRRRADSNLSDNARYRQSPSHPQGHQHQRTGSGHPLFDAPGDFVYVDDIEQAVEAIEQPGNVEDAIDTLEALELAQQDTAAGAAAAAAAADDDGVQQVVVVEEDQGECDSDIDTSKEELAADIIEYMVDDDTDRTERVDREAAVSASLYMNPAMKKIASNLVITWEPAVAEVLDRLARLSNPSRPLLVGLIGIPGSGKSTSAEIVSTLLGGMDDRQDEERAIVMPMDGFHLPLKTLAESENSADLIYRRGAPDTFDPAGLFAALNEIAYGKGESVTIPGFDHAQGDPVPNQHTFVRSTHEIVIVEGIYLLHDDDGWEPMKRLFDWTIYIDADVDGCVERLKIRNKCIPGYTPEEIEARCDIVDRHNAELSRDSAFKYASQIVTSGAS